MFLNNFRETRTTATPPNKTPTRRRVSLPFALSHHGPSRQHTSPEHAEQVLTGIPLGILGELVELSRVSVESRLGSGAARWWVRVVETEVLSVRRV